MLAAAAVGLLAVAGDNHLLQASRAVIGQDSLPAWDGAGYGCQSALYLINLYFDVNFDENNQDQPPPPLEYKDILQCDDNVETVDLGCFRSFRNGAVSITVKNGLTPEGEHYTCFHEVCSRPCSRFTLAAV